MLLLKFKRFKVEDSVIVCGEPRSGTTWLLEILSKIPNTFTNWEPLHHKYRIVPPKWKWGDRVFIPKEDHTLKYYRLIKNILNLRVYNKWTVRVNRQSITGLLNSRFVITKFIRANLLLPYIVHNFKLKNQPILILRHPIDTCISQIKLYSSVPHHDWLNNERYLKETKYLQKLSSKLEYEIALWCINNSPLLEDKETLDQLNVVFYSDLILNPEREARKLLDQLTIGIDQYEVDKLISTIDFRKPSKSDFGEDFIADPEKQLQKNIAKLTAAEKHGIQRVFDHFGLKLYDAYSIFPNKDSL